MSPEGGKDLRLAVGFMFALLGTGVTLDAYNDNQERRDCREAGEVIRNTHPSEADRTRLCTNAFIRKCLPEEFCKDK